MTVRVAAGFGMPWSPAGVPAGRFACARKGEHPCARTPTALRKVPSCVAQGRTGKGGHVKM